MSRVAHPPSFSPFNTLDPFQQARSHRALPAHRNARASGKSVLTLETLEAPPRVTRSLDLDPRLRLPIGPHPSGSGSRSSTPTPTYPPSVPSILSPSRSSLDSINSRETRAQRRQGSIFNVPVSLNPNLNASYSSLVATHTQASQSGGEGYSQHSAMSSVRGISSGKTNTRLRKANVPAPLDLDTSNRPTRDPALRPPTPGAAPTTKRGPPLPTNPQPPRSRRRSRSASFFLDSSTGSSYPTPLTPSFRFLAPQLPEHREKKLNKLARTLGEEIPASLVFPSTSSASTSATSKAESSAPSTPVSDRLITTEHVTEKSFRRASKMVQALDLDSSLSARQKNPKGVSTWQPPCEWSMDPAEIQRDRDVPGGSGCEEDEDEVQSGWNADSYDAVLERLRNLKR